MTWSPPESFVDALVGAIVGGVLTGVAGFLGILYVRGKDKGDEHTRFLAAVTVVWVSLSWQRPGQPLLSIRLRY
jgi:hypothetical protein